MGTSFKFRQTAARLFSAFNKRAAKTQQVVAVGIFGPKGKSKHRSGNGETVAQIASRHEFGIGAPQRSFIRPTIRELTPALRSQMRKIAKKQTEEQNFDFTKQLQIVGLHVQGAIQTKISSSVPPPNAPSTVKRKGSSTTLIDTGQMRSSITHKVFKNRDEVEAGT